MKKNKKVILFGLGRMGLRYLKIIDELNLNLVGIYDKNYNNAKKLLKKIIFIKVYCIKIYNHC